MGGVWRATVEHNDIYASAVKQVLHKNKTTLTTPNTLF